MDLREFGWNRFFQDAFAPHIGALTPGRVASENRGHYLLWSSSGEHSAVLAGALRDAGPAPVTGDWVGFDLASNRIHAVLPRRTTVSRRQPGRAVAEQVLAANVDVLFVVSALDGDFNLRRLERYLTLVRSAAVWPVVVLTKFDVANNAEAHLDEARQRIPADVPIVALDARQPAAAAELGGYLTPGQTLVALGSSGAGKSTLTNTLLGRVEQATGAVREDDSRGRHTTTVRSLHMLPGGACIIDTPGLRGLRVDTDEDGLNASFADIVALAGDCRFRDCRHSGEPGCAVRPAVHPDRLANFHKMRREIRRETMTIFDRRKQLAEWKARSRGAEERMKLKRG